MSALTRIGRITVFLLWYAGQVLRANAVVIAEILTPRSRIAPAFLELPLRSRSDAEITLIANLITLTPGTVTVAVRAEPATLWVHGLHVRDVRSFRAELEAMEARMLHAFRPVDRSGAVR